MFQILLKILKFLVIIKQRNFLRLMIYGLAHRQKGKRVGRGRDTKSMLYLCYIKIM